MISEHLENNQGYEDMSLEHDEDRNNITSDEIEGYNAHSPLTKEIAYNSNNSLFKNKHKNRYNSITVHEGGGDVNSLGEGTEEVPSLSYDEWINSFITWRDVGDKCIMKGLFALGADMYGQGLVRDTKAFHKPSQWYRFAKACYKSGRTSDAQLAIKVGET